MAGLLALMLLHHARRDARWAGGELVPLAEQDRSRWDTAMIASGVDLLQDALARDRLGEYQAQAAIAALHCDAASAEETDWAQVVSSGTTSCCGSPTAPWSRSTARSPSARPTGRSPGCATLDAVPASVPRRTAAEAWLQERAGEPAAARSLYAAAAAQATSEAERTHLTRQAARLRDA